jgi:dihydrofolate reductase
VRELKQQGDGHLVIYGYGQLAQTLLEHRLVDELNLVINPVMVGSGTTLFRPGKRARLRLVSVTERRNGVVTLSYANDLRTESGAGIVEPGKRSLKQH